MPVTYVGGSTSSSTVSATSRTLNMPPGVTDGDYGIVVFGRASGTTTAPSGWTMLDEVTAGTAIGQIWVKALSAGDAGTSITFSISSTQRVTATLAVYRGVDAVGAHASGSNLGTSHPVPPVTADADDSCPVTLIFERSSTPSTGFTAPSGYSSRAASFGDGSGACSSGIADNLGALSADGDPVGAGSWTATGSNTAIVWTLALPQGAASPLSGTLVLAPDSGVAPLSVSATAVFTGGTGTPKEYRFVWGDGASTGWQSGGSATHVYEVAGNYTAAASNPVYVECRNT